VSESSQTSGGEPFDVEEFARDTINAIEYRDRWCELPVRRASGG
jgi:hypothetical protein